MADVVSRSRSSSPPTSGDSPASSHSTPDSSDFNPADNINISSPWKSPISEGVSPRLLLKPDTPMEVWMASNGDYNYAPHPKVSRHDIPRLKTDDESEGAIFSEYIQEDAFDLAPPSYGLSGASSSWNATQSKEPSMHSNASRPGAVYLPSTSTDNNTFGQPYSNAPNPATSFTPSSLTRTINPQHSQRPFQGSAAFVPAVSEPGSSLPSGSASPTGSIIYPAKASCANLPIQITNIPEKGAKSRVETQIKMDLELAMPVSFGTGQSQAEYRRVASWKWLRLSRGATTKKRPKKDAKQESTSEETLYLSTEVICASAPDTKVHACSSCISREAKRIERKKATRVRPIRSDSSEDESSVVPKAVADQIQAEENEVDDGSRIILFNCPELVDFTNGIASLPVRITCYCRHHREKIGFKIIFTMRDSTGRIVGKGVSPPVMITDDHKTTSKNAAAEDEEEDVDGQSSQPQQKRKRRTGPKKETEQDGDVVMDGHGEEDQDEARSKRKPKPCGSTRKSTVPTSYKSSRHGTASGRSSRLGTPSRRSSPPAVAVSTAVSRQPPQPPLFTPFTPQTTVPASFDFNAMTSTSPSHPTSSQPSTVSNSAELDAVLASLDAFTGQSPLSASLGSPLAGAARSSSAVDITSDSPFLPMVPYSAQSPISSSTAPASPLTTTLPLGNSTALSPSLTMLAESLLSTNILPSVMSPPAVAPQTRAPSSTITPSDVQAAPPPAIHRLIPNSGPMHGGIEVTILGANFNSSLQCVFGDTVAMSTHMWSENTIVCILPPSPSPGPVIVWFRDIPLNASQLTVGSNSQVDGLLGLGTAGLQWFTYLDSTDRGLMELALQVVGLKMTGRIEDAKNVAMRIVGTNSLDMASAGSSTAGQSMSGGHQMSLSDSPVSSRRGSAIDLSSSAAQIVNPSRSRDFQSVVIEFLSVLDVTVEGNSSEIPTKAAISHPNPTGQTLLHLAAILGFHRLTTFLISHNADMDARDKNGFTPLHFAAICGRRACANLLVESGADLEIVEGRGRTAKELAREHDQIDVETLLEEAEHRYASDECLEEAYDSDMGVGFGTEEDDGDDEESGAQDDEAPLRMRRRDDSSTVTPPSRGSESKIPKSAPLSRVQSVLLPRPTSRVSFLQNPDNAGSDLYSSEEESKPVELSKGDSVPPPLPVKDTKLLNEKLPSLVDTSTAWIGRTLAHLQPPPAYVPELPWGLPNIAIPAFPVQVQLPSWPAALQRQGEKVPRPFGEQVSWRSWYGAAGAGWWSEKTPRIVTPSTQDPVPMYTPSADEVATPVEYDEPPPEEPQGIAPSKAVVRAKLARRLGFDPGSVTEREVQAYDHYTRKMRKLKKDRMLVLFWLPILLIVIAWGLYETFPIAMATIKPALRNLAFFRDPIHA